MFSFKRNSLLVIFSLLFLIATGCGTGQDDQTEEGNEGTTNTGDLGVENVATVNGENITAVEYLSQLDYAKQFYAMQGLNLEEEGNEELLEKVEEDLLDSLIMRTLVLQEAARVNVGPSDEEVNIELENFKSQFPEEEDFTQALDENNYTEEELRDELKQELTYRQLLQLEHLEADELTITEADLMERYEELSEQYDLGEFEEVQADLEEDVKLNKFLENLRESASIEIFI